MFTLSRRSLGWPALVLCCWLIAPARAAEPGLPLPTDATANDQKPGAVLFYNLYTSSVSAPNVQNTRVTITNTNQTEVTPIRLFLVDTNAGLTDPLSILGSSICLVPNQTAAFLVSDIDPGVTGFIVALATDENGCPKGFNYLTGRAEIKLATGHQATLPAQAMATYYSGVLPGCNGNATTATLRFDGNSYDRLPRVLALDKIGSRADGNDTLVVINRVGGNVSFRTGTIGYFKGVMYEEGGGSYEFTDSHGRTQYFVRLSDALPIFAETKFERLVPAGARGWMKFWAQNDYGLFGALFTRNANGFNGAQNLRVLSLTDSATLTVPIIQAGCGF